MAQPQALSVTIDAPVLSEILQAIHDLRAEVRDLRTEDQRGHHRLSTRLEAIETQLGANHPTTQSPSRHSSVLPQEDIDDNPRIPRDEHTAASTSTSQSASPELTSMDAPVSPVAGKKRKRRGGTACPHDANINGPSRSESPFDKDNRGDESSSDLEVMPPTRPQSKPSMLPPPTSCPQRREADKETTQTEAGSITPESEEVSMSQYGRVRKQTQRPKDFVSLPTEREINRMSRQQRR